MVRFLFAAAATAAAFRPELMTEMMTMRWPMR